MRYAVLLVILSLVFLSCNRTGNNDDDADNHAPVISSISPNTIGINEAVMINCLATDADDDSLSYLWTTESGSFEGAVNTAAVLWNAPSVAGTYSVFITVSDGFLSDSEEHQITVTGVTLPTAFISGYVLEASLFSTKETNSYIEGAEICLDTICVFSSSSGLYTFSGITYSTYTMTVSKDGYFTYTDSFVVDTPSEVLNIRLSSEGSECGFGISPTALMFGIDYDSLDFQITNSGDMELDWTITSNQSWLSAVVWGGSIVPSASDRIGVLVDRSDLDSGDYSGLLTIAADPCTTRYMTVEMTISATSEPVLYVQPDLVDFGTVAEAMTIIIQNAGTGAFSWNTSSTDTWFAISPTSGIVSDERDSVTLSINRASLAAGDYVGEVIINSISYGSDTVSVRLTVVGDEMLTVTPDTLDYSTSSSSENITLTSSMSLPISWTATGSEPWIAGSSGSLSALGADIVEITIERSILDPGLNTGFLYISSPETQGDTLVILATDPSITGITVEPDTLDFSTSTTELLMNISNGGVSTTTWYATLSESWFELSPAAGSILSMDNATPTVTVTRTGLTAGTHTGYVTIYSGATVDTVVIRCEAMGAVEDFAIYPDTIDFGDVSVTENLMLENNLSYSVSWYGAALESWIEMGSTAGSIPPTSSNPIPITISRGDLEDGLNFGSVYIYCSGLPGDTITVRANKLLLDSD